MTSQHPGYLLSKELQTANMTQKELAQLSGISNTSLNKIIRGHRDFTPEIAVRLERVLGKSARFWLHAQANYDIQKARDTIPVYQFSLNGQGFSVKSLVLNN